MENQVHIIIAHCEEEKNRLQQWIKEFIDESDYLAAHYHSQALYRLNYLLYTLKCVDDQLYAQKFFHEQRIEGIKRMLERKEFAHMHMQFERDINDALNEIEQLNKIPPPEPSQNNDAILAQALNDLIDRKIKNFKLVLHKKNNFLLRFSYAKKTLHVRLPYVKQHIEKFELEDEKIEVLKRLGFNLSDNQTLLTLTLKGEKEKILSRLWPILVKIVFEIFHFRHFKNETYIQFTEIERHQ